MLDAPVQNCEVQVRTDIIAYVNYGSCVKARHNEKQFLPLSV